MVAVAIFSADPILRRSLEQLPRDDPAVTLVGIVDHSSGLPKLLNQNQVDVVLMDIPTGAQLNEWQGFHNNHVALMVLIGAAEAGDTVEALNAGAQAVLRRSTSPNEIGMASEPRGKRAAPPFGDRLPAADARGDRGDDRRQGHEDEGRQDQRKLNRRDAAGSVFRAADEPAKQSPHRRRGRVREGNFA